MVINHLPSIVKSVTSPHLKEICFILSGLSLEKHCRFPDKWELLDVEICNLVDRIQPTCCQNWGLSLRFVITSAISTATAGKFATTLLPASAKHKYISASIDHPGLS